MKGKAFLALLVFTTAAINTAPDAKSYRQLPKAGFQTRSGSMGQSALPRVDGLHLNTDDNAAPQPIRSQGEFAGPYNPGEPTLNWQRVRWERNKMPLYVWISPGLKLPEAPFDQLQATRVDLVTQMMQQENPFASCTQCPGWIMDMNYQTDAGFEQWREFEKEGLFKFEFTTNPYEAHIMVFFVDNFKSASGPGGIAVAGNTCAQIYPIAQAHQIKIRQKPVIIELSTMVNDTPPKMIGASAHEFGHALGIKAHSPNRADIMNIDRINNFLSPDDKATIRNLYKNPVQWVM